MRPTAQRSGKRQPPGPTWVRSGRVGPEQPGHTRVNEALLDEDSVSSILRTGPVPRVSSPDSLPPLGELPRAPAAHRGMPPSQGVPPRAQNMPAWAQAPHGQPAGQTQSPPSARAQEPWAPEGQEGRLHGQWGTGAEVFEEDLSTRLYDPADYGGDDEASAELVLEASLHPSWHDSPRHGSPRHDSPRHDSRHAASLSLVRSVSESVEAEEVRGLRAKPSSPEPRPQALEVVDWPPPMVRPESDAAGAFPRVFGGWVDEVGDTRIVLDPLKRQPTSRVLVLALDVAAWMLGFVTMFIAGMMTTLSVALVLFALSLG